MSTVRCFVKTFANGNIPIIAEKGWKVSNLKAKVLESLHLQDDVTAKYALGFSKDGVLIPEESGCDILHNDDFLLLCKFH